MAPGDAIPPAQTISYKEELIQSQHLCTKDVHTSYWDEIMDNDSSDEEGDDEDIPTVALSSDDNSIFEQYG